MARVITTGVAGFAPNQPSQAERLAVDHAAKSGTERVGGPRLHEISNYIKLGDQLAQSPLVAGAMQKGSEWLDKINQFGEGAAGAMHAKRLHDEWVAKQGQEGAEPSTPGGWEPEPARPGSPTPPPTGDNLAPRMPLSRQPAIDEARMRRLNLQHGQLLDQLSSTKDPRVVAYLNKELQKTEEEMLAINTVGSESPKGYEGYRPPLRNLGDTVPPAPQSFGRAENAAADKQLKDLKPALQTIDGGPAPATEPVNVREGYQPKSALEQEIARLDNANFKSALKMERAKAHASEQAYGQAKARGENARIEFDYTTLNALEKEAARRKGMDVQPVLGTPMAKPMAGGAEEAPTTPGTARPAAGATPGATPGANPSSPEPVGKDGLFAIPGAGGWKYDPKTGSYVAPPSAAKEKPTREQVLAMAASATTKQAREEAFKMAEEVDVPWKSLAEYVSGSHRKGFHEEILKAFPKGQVKSDEQIAAEIALKKAEAGLKDAQRVGIPQKIAIEQDKVDNARRKVALAEKVEPVRARAAATSAGASASRARTARLEFNEKKKEGYYKPKAGEPGNVTTARKSLERAEDFLRKMDAVPEPGKDPGAFKGDPMMDEAEYKSWSKAKADYDERSTKKAAATAAADKLRKDDRYIRAKKTVDEFEKPAPVAPAPTATPVAPATTPATTPAAPVAAPTAAPVTAPAATPAPAAPPVKFDDKGRPIFGAK